MKTENVLALARKHLGGQMESSARLCLADAVSLWDAGQIESARKRAIDSLKFSIGIFHQDFKRIK